VGLLVGCEGSVDRLRRYVGLDSCDDWPVAMTNGTIHWYCNQLDFFRTESELVVLDNKVSESIKDLQTIRRLNDIIFLPQIMQGSESYTLKTDKCLVNSYLEWIPEASIVLAVHS
jgi:hypothetical protein